MFSGRTFVGLTMCTCDTVKFISNLYNIQQHPLCIGVQVISSPSICIGSAVNMSGQFTYGLCDCFGDWRICCIAFWVPCLQVGQNAAYFGEDKTAACWLNFCFNCPYEMLVRHRLRLLRGIPGSMTTDMALTFLCGLCVLVQDAREIDEAKKAGLTSGQLTVTAVSNPQDMDIKRI